MDRYLVVSPHVPEECVKAIEQVVAMGHITHFDWGCMDGDHTGWTIIEAENHSHALMSVPSFLRGKAKAIKLTKFGPEDVASWHKKP
ncbi:MAG: hypothetical protein WBW16_01335 [Bacteroidota bacterium]